MRLILQNIQAVDFSEFVKLDDGKFQIKPQTLLFDAIIEGPKGENDIVEDFGLLKPAIRDLLKERIDHRLIVDDMINFHDGAYKQEGFCLRVPFNNIWNGSLASVIEEIEDEIADMDNFLDKKLTIKLQYHEPNLIRDFDRIDRNSFFVNYVPLDYAHGLSWHSGKCANLLHGHSSLIYTIGGDAMMPHYLSLLVAGDKGVIFFSKKYLNCVDGTTPGNLERLSGRYRYEYKTDSGEFYSFVFDTSKFENIFYYISGEPTAENLAEEVAEHLIKKTKRPGKMSVGIYEGYGSIAEISI